MTKIASLLHSRALNVLIGSFLAFFWVLFAYRQLQAFEATRTYVFLVFCISETLQAGFFLFRSIPKSVSLEPFDWMVAVGGTFTVLFFRPEGVVLWAGASLLVFVGAIVQLGGLLSLNRSFALVAAKREIKTFGLYKFVRHPMYASYLLIYTGYLLLNADLYNLILCILAFAFLFLRIESEEALLSKDPDYVSYKARVRCRLIPFVY